MKKIVPLHVNILTVFTMVICVIVMSVVSYGYLRNADSAVLAAQGLLEKIGSSIVERTEKLFDTAFMTVDTCVSFQGIDEKASIHSHLLSPVFLKVLDQHPDFTSMFIGFADGDFFLISSLVGREDMKKSLGIPAAAVWYTQTIGHKADGQRYQLKRYLDGGYRTLGSSADLDVDYDPRTRGWFQTSIGSDAAKISDIYLFALSGEPGITVSRRFDGDTPGVFGVDLSLSNLSRFTREQLVGDSSEIVIFNAQGDIYAYPDIQAMKASISLSGGSSATPPTVESLGSPVLSELRKNYLEDSGKEAGAHRRLTVEGTQYLANIYPLPPEYGTELFVGIAVPEDVFTGPIALIGQHTLFVSLAILILSLPVVYIVARRLSRPLNLLTQSMDKITAFELDESVEMTSNIVEIRKLGKATETMREALKAFGSYIPKPLVQAMVVNNIKPELGGDRQTMTFFFSDIKDFTSISESLTPEEVTGSVTRYLKQMGAIILKNEGTIDKYIGDSIMAFWNAPVANENHARLACLSALQCHEKLLEFNSQCTLDCDPVFLTRMGVHTGEAVVGNIGSSDRMDYTAMGASVNLASRLEGLNKHLGTEILVSETTRQGAGEDFVYRFAGRVTPKGASVSLGVYELIGTKCDASGIYAPHAVCAEVESHVQEWQMAIDKYLARDFEGAVTAFSDYLDQHEDDVLASNFLSMAREFAANPPAADWCGEQVFHVK